MTLYRYCPVLLIFLSLAAGCRGRSDQDTGNASHPTVAQTLNLPVTSIRGTWYGLFKPAHDEVQIDTITGENKAERPHTITLFIDRMENGEISGRSVCAGLDRPFSGVFTEDDSRIKAKLSEAGGNKYDGTFDLEIDKKQFQLEGTWTPFDHNRDSRTYTLTRKNFSYDPSAGIHPEASLRLLKSDDVNNLLKDELREMRNEIYARHGYAFKVKDVQAFFDGQPWYMPISLDVRKSLTSIELKNEKLIKQFEKYADESYDDYGR